MWVSCGSDWSAEEEHSWKFDEIRFSLSFSENVKYFWSCYRHLILVSNPMFFGMGNHGESCGTIFVSLRLIWRPRNGWRGCRRPRTSSRSEIINLNLTVDFGVRATRDSHFLIPHENHFRKWPQSCENVSLLWLRMEHRRDFTDQRTFGLTHNSSLWYVQNQSQNFTTSTWASPPTAPPTCSRHSDGPEAPENRPKWFAISQNMGFDT